MNNPNNELVEQKLLDAWEEVYKRGLLTLWILLAVREKPRHAADITNFITLASNGTLSIEEQSMYRSLRRFAESGMLTFKEGQSIRGPDRKIYELTATGHKVLERFIRRNIAGVYFNPPNRKFFIKRK